MGLDKRRPNKSPSQPPRPLLSSPVSNRPAPPPPPRLGECQSPQGQVRGKYLVVGCWLVDYLYGIFGTPSTLSNSSLLIAATTAAPTTPNQTASFSSATTSIETATLTPHEKELQEETERLQREIEALKRLQQLKQQEEELKQWLAGHEEDGVVKRRSSSQGNKNDNTSFYNQATPLESASSSYDEYDFGTSTDIPHSPGGGGIKKRTTTRRNKPTTTLDDLDESDYSVDDSENKRYRGGKKKSSSSLPISTQLYNLGNQAYTMGLGVVSEVMRRCNAAAMSDSSGRSGGAGDASHSSPVNGSDVEHGGSPLSRGRGKKKKKKGPSLKAKNTRELLHKIAIAIVTDLDDDTLQHEDTETILIIITLIKEALLGIFIAFCAVSFLLFFDYSLGLNIPTATNFRRATFAVMNERETLRNWEENVGIKFMDYEEFSGIGNEIDNAKNKTELAASILDTRSLDLINMQRDLSKTENEMNGFMKKLGLDNFCEDCQWSHNQKKTCIERVNELGDKYKTPKFKAIMSAMQKDSCNKNGIAKVVETSQDKVFREFREADAAPPPPPPPPANKLTAEEDVVQNWHKHAANFCDQCSWEEGMTCIKRSKFLNERYGSPLIEAMAKTLVETEKCRYSYYEQKIASLGGFCGTCVWGTKKSQTCNARVEYLMYTYKNAEVEAQLATMNKAACRNKNKV